MPLPPPLTFRHRGLPLHRHALTLADRHWLIDAVRDQSALLDAADGFDAFPFGLLLWESSLVAAQVLTEQSCALCGVTALELGAGTGLTGLAAAAAGADVRQTDHLPDAIALCRQNAALNGITRITAEVADWTAWDDDRRYDLVIGADVLYDTAAHAPVRAILERNVAAGGRALLTDPGRMHTPAFVAALRDGDWQVTTSVRDVPAIQPTRPGQRVAITLIECRRR